MSVDVEKDRGPVMTELVANASIAFGNEDKLQEYASRRHDERPAERSSESLFSYTYAPSDAATDSERSVERSEECLHRISSLLRQGEDAIQRGKSVVVTR